MINRLRSIFLLDFPGYFIFLFLAIIYISFTCQNLLAQDNDDDQTPAIVIEKTKTVFINRDFIEIVTLKDVNDELLADTPITVTVDNSDIAAISVLNPSIEDQIVVEGSILIANTGGNGQKAFLIEGKSSGSTKIEFEVISEDNAAPIIEELKVNVIDLEAIIQVDKNFGEAPLTVRFSDISNGKTDTRIWTFRDSDLDISNETNPEHKFENSGIFETTLEIAQGTSFGTVTDKTSISICVTPGGVRLPGVIFGTIFDPITNLPINRVEILLLTDSGERLERTGRDGTYRFENVIPGTLIFTVCKTPFFECIVEEIEYDGGTLTKNFQLVRRGSTP